MKKIIHSKYCKLFFLLYIFLLFYINLSSSINSFTPPFFLIGNNVSKQKNFQTEPERCAEQMVTNGLVQSVHCASALEVADNKVRAFWYGGSREGATDVAIYTSLFSPENEKWSNEKVILTPVKASKQQKSYIKKLGNPVVIRDLKNRIWLFFVSVSVGGWAGSSVNYIISDDEGESFTKAKRLKSSPFLNISNLVKGKPFLYTDGTIGLPVYHECLGKFAELLRISEYGRIISKTRISWGRKTLSPEILPLSATEAICFLRYTGRKDRYIYASKTIDGGLNWTKMKKTTLPNHNSAFNCLRLNNGLIIKVLNHSDKERDDLTLVVSDDDAVSWRKLAVFEQDVTIQHGLKHEYSYPWMIQMRNGDFHIFYTWRRKHIKHITFNQTWLENRL